MKIHARILATALCLAASAAQAAQLEADRTYPAGSRIDSPWSGISVTVPQGYTAAYDHGARALLMGDGSGSRLVGVFGASRAAVADFAEVLVEHLAGLGIEMVPQSIRETTGGAIEASYLAYANGQLQALAGTVVPGSQGNVLGVVVLGPKSDSERLMQTARSISQGASWSQPTAGQWRARLSGLVLQGGGSDSGFSRSGLDHISTAGDSRREIHFCSDGSYRFASKTQSFLSTGAGSIESNSSDAHQGRWELVADFAGTAYLVLSASDGREFLWEIEETGSGATVDGASYSADRSPLCG